MAFPGSSEVELLLRLQEGAVGEGGWSGFLAHLAEVTDARFAVILAGPGFDPSAAITSAMPSGRSLAVDGAALRFILADQMRPERIYSGEELAEIIDTGDGLTINAALARLGVVSVRAMRVVVPTVASLHVGIFSAREFNAADSAVLRRIFPFLQAAARTGARLEQERFRASQTASLAGRTALGWFLLDRAGTVLDAWIDMPSTVSDVLSCRPGERLTFKDRAAGPAVAAALDWIGSNPASPERAAWVSQDPPIHVRLAPWTGGASPSAGRPLATATLYGQCHVAAEAATPFVDLFGLLPSEARLVVALANGHSLAGAAAMLGLTIETARNYSRKIFAKTGTRGQSDLVRLVLTNGLAEIGHTQSRSD